MDEGAVFFALNNLLDNLLDKLRDLLGDTLLFDTIKPDKKITEVVLARRPDMICTPQRQAGRGQEAAGCSPSSRGAVARGRYGRGAADAISWPAAKGMGTCLCGAPCLMIGMPQRKDPCRRTGTRFHSQGAC